MAADGVQVAIRLSRAVKAAVTAPPEGGRANEAPLQLLSASWHLRRRDLSIVQGHSNRSKVVHVTGDPQRLAEQISSEIAGLPRW
jgi:uncharacterized protein YggU (UPF0235/DUF167 family)